jgi:hypothetical protein
MAMQIYKRKIVIINWSTYITDIIQWLETNLEAENYQETDGAVLPWSPTAVD